MIFLFLFFFHSHTPNRVHANENRCNGMSKFLAREIFLEYIDRAWLVFVHPDCCVSKDDIIADSSQLNLLILFGGILTKFQIQ